MWSSLLYDTERFYWPKHPLGSSDASKPFFPSTLVAIVWAVTLFWINTFVKLENDTICFYQNSHHSKICLLFCKLITLLLWMDSYSLGSLILLQFALLTFPHLSTPPGLYLECVWSCLNAHPLNSDIFWAAKSIAFILIYCLWIGSQSFCNDYDVWLLERYFFMALKEVSSGNSRDVDWHSSYLLLIFLSIFFPILIAVGTDFTVSHHSRPLDIASNLLLLLFIASFNIPDLISILKHPVKKQTRMHHKETP